MTGLDEILRMIAAGARPPMLDLLDIRLAEVRKGEVVFVASPGQSLYNPLGIVHGGFAATILDSACGLAACSATDVPMDCITLELKLSYHAPLREEVGEVRATGRVLSLGRRIAFTEARLVDAQDRLYASATSTLSIRERQDSSL